MQRVAQRQTDTGGSLGRQILTFSSPLREARDLDSLLGRIGDARYVLLGEASHGTHEYYQWRARNSRRLIEEKDFRFIAVEGDWPDCFRVNWFIHGKGEDATADEALRKYNRWPTWVWAN
jgi:erythromycin esterase-like protein